MIIDFNDAVPGRYFDIADGYDHFHWHNLGVASGTNAASGYGQVATDSSQVGFNISGSPGYFSADQDFDFKGGWFAAAWETGLTVKFAGFDDGVKVATHKVVLDQVRTWVGFDSGFDSVDRVRISTKPGVDTEPDIGRGPHVAMEDLVVQFERAAHAEHHAMSSSAGDLVV